jgi:uncharacterized protein (TIGR03435 family)
MRAKKHLILCAIVLGALSGRGAFAQDITGTWQGTRKGPEDARVVIKISRLDGGLRAVAYNIDQGGQAQSETVSLLGSAVEISFPTIGSGSTYKGTLGSDQQSITGTWTAARQSSLDLVRPTLDTSWTQFEVASIKPNNSGAPPPRKNPFACLPGGRFTATNVTLMDMIVLIYPASGSRVRMQGGPDWRNSERFDIVAKADATQSNVKTVQCNLMLQSLLEDRFKLKLHLEAKEMSAWALITGKSPPKLLPTKEGEETTMVSGPRGQMNFQRMPIQGLVNVVENIVQVPFVDATGIKGFYDFTVNPAQFAPTGTANSNVPPISYGDLVLTSVQEELGFKLEKRKMLLEITIIDQAERPTDN